jgi:hypothetical protein
VQIDYVGIRRLALQNFLVTSDNLDPRSVNGQGLRPGSISISGINVTVNQKRVASQQRHWQEQGSNDAGGHKVSAVSQSIHRVEGWDGNEGAIINRNPAIDNLNFRFVAEAVGNYPSPPAEESLNRGP